MSVSKKRVRCTIKSTLSELPYANVEIIRAHGQFNNILNSDLPTKKYLDKLHISLMVLLPGDKLLTLI